MVGSVRLWSTLFLGLISCAASAPTSFTNSASAAAAPSDGIIRLDVVVSDKAGNPVTGLKPEDFTVFDNGEARQLVSFRTHSEALNKIDEPLEIILVIDAVNLSSQQIAAVEREAGKFLRQDQGRLPHPVTIYRLKGSALMSSGQPSTDGNALAEEIEKRAEKYWVWARYIEHDPLSTADRNISSLNALGAIAIDARSRPGRKLLFWIGLGWPVNAGGDYSFNEAVEFSGRLREARITVFNVNAWETKDSASVTERGIKAVRYPDDVKPGDLALEVLVAKSGGRVLATGPEIGATIQKAVEQAAAYYALSFDPPLSTRADEFHELKVAVDRPDAVVLTNAEYYDQPTFYDQPAGRRERVAVERLRQVLKELRSLSDTDAARRLSNMELTERLSQAGLAEMKLQLRGPKTEEALVLLADCSQFLAPPIAEIPQIAVPDPHDRHLMLDRTLRYLLDTLPTLPNFSATRTTVRYEEAPRNQNQSWKVAAQDETLHAAAVEAVTVLIQNSKETTEAERAKKVKHDPRRERSLVTEGTFGSMLAQILADASDAHSRVRWNRWEQGPHGPLAVFHYSIPQESGHFEVSFCCLAESGGKEAFHGTTGYHGEIAIDPETGVIHRITTEADLAPRLPLLRSDVMVEYGSVMIGGRTYVCPLRSVSISRGRTVQLIPEWWMSFGVYGPFESIVNDVTFSDYHLFRSEHRILTDVDPAQ